MVVAVGVVAVVDAVVVAGRLMESGQGAPGMQQLNAVQQALYQGIQALPFDEPAAARSMAQRLAQEHRWSPEYVQRVMAEYKRFLFLAMVAGHVVTPSEDVDEVWHLHMLYSREYWNGLCKEVLGRPLHHAPSRGGYAEQRKYRMHYRETLASYRAWFGECPSADIWPAPEVRFCADARWVRIDASRYWLLPRPRWFNARTLVRLVQRLWQAVR